MRRPAGEFFVRRSEKRREYFVYYSLIKQKRERRLIRCDYIGEILFRMTRQIIAGILCVFQDCLTQSDGKRAAEIFTSGLNEVPQIKKQEQLLPPPL